MISVIIPALNEARTISSVVAFARRVPIVSEVMVVDDGSVDGTPDLARAAGAKVILSSLLGKGASMEDGVRTAGSEVLLYIDADLSSMHPDLIQRMAGPILDDHADFVKGSFSRRAGRVTVLTAKPLLKVFFPDLASFEQPLGGVVAARRCLLRQLRFETDYGVDIGLLIDAATQGARIAEVDIGHIEHDSHPLQNLSDMACQVTRTILDRAARYGRLRGRQVRSMAELERSCSDLSVLAQKLGKVERLALFDMDGTLLDGRYIVNLALRCGRNRQLPEYLDTAAYSPERRAQAIAGLFRGVPRNVFEDVARTIPLMPEAAEVVIGLRKLGYRVGIVTDSFHFVAEIVRRRVFADFSVGHFLEFRDGRATGGLTISPTLAHRAGCPRHAFCKVNVMLRLLEAFQLTTAEVLAVGDGDNDICMLKGAGRSYSFRPKSDAVRMASDHVITGSIIEILRTLSSRTVVSA